MGVRVLHGTKLVNNDPLPLYHLSMTYALRFVTRIPLTNYASKNTRVPVMAESTVPQKWRESLTVGGKRPTGKGIVKDA